MRRPPPERVDFFTSTARSALEDIRAKLIDEGWFGRPSAERQQAYADMRDLYGQDAQAPGGSARPEWTDRLKEQQTIRTDDMQPEIDR